MEKISLSEGLMAQMMENEAWVHRHYETQRCAYGCGVDGEVFAASAAIPA